MKHGSMKNESETHESKSNGSISNGNEYLEQKECLTFYFGFVLE
ncbi:MAG: hypothetical protein VX313_01640 [Bacteroidota bacterium]|nr:hypothetical protein [Bacteroidota bacterium]